MQDFPHLSLMKGMLQPGAGQDMPQVTLACLSDYFCSWPSPERAEGCPLLHPAGVCTGSGCLRIPLVHVASGIGFLPGWTPRLTSLSTVSHRNLLPGQAAHLPAGRLCTSLLKIGRGLIIVKGQHWLLMGALGCSTSLRLSMGLLGHTAHLG